MSKKMIKHIKITGRVQGVGFRYFTYKKAQEHNIAGWVKNCDDGSVEALFVGEESDVEIMVKEINNGPPMANVSRISELDSDKESGDLKSFKINR